MMRAPTKSQSELDGMLGEQRLQERLSVCILVAIAIAVGFEVVEEDVKIGYWHRTTYQD